MTLNFKCCSETIIEVQQERRRPNSFFWIHSSKATVTRRRVKSTLISVNVIMNRLTFTKSKRARPTLSLSLSLNQATSPHLLASFQVPLFALPFRQPRKPVFSLLRGLLATKQRALSKKMRARSALPFEGLHLPGARFASLHLRLAAVCVARQKLQYCRHDCICICFCAWT